MASFDYAEKQQYNVEYLVDITKYVMKQHEYLKQGCGGGSSKRKRWKRRIFVEAEALA